VQSALAKVEGVQDVKVDLKDGKASIIAAKGKVTADQLIKAVADIPGGRFKATPN
jgi:copper chaperone CopZ